MEQDGTRVNLCVLALGKWVLDDNGALPDYMSEPVARYLMYGQRPEPNGFLEAIICDKPFSQVVPLADGNNVICLMTWHRILHNIFPSQCWKSHESMLAWCAQGGTMGEPIPYLWGYLPENLRS